jgi:hypothetical protein
VRPHGLALAARLLGTTLLALWAISLPAATSELASAAHAQDVEEPDLRLRVTELSRVLGPGAAPGLENDTVEPTEPPDVPEDLDVRVLLENEGEAAVDGLRLVVEVHPVVTDRAALGEALDDGEVPTTPLFVRDEPVRDLEDIEPGEIAGATDRIDGEAIPWAEDGGVHPVRIAVVRGAQVLDEVVTGVVWLGDRPEAPLLTTAVWPLDDAPWRTERGHYAVTAQGEIRPGGRIDALLRGLERHPDAGVLVSPAAHLLEDLDDQALGYVELIRHPDGAQEANPVEPEDRSARLANDTLQRIREVTRELPHAPVTGPYADADLGALAEHDQAMRDLGGELAAVGRQRLQALLDRPPDASSMVLADRIDPSVLDLLPADHLLLPPELVEGPVTDGLASLRSPSGRLMSATVGDPRLRELLEEPHDEHGALIAAQRVLAETAAHWFEDPGANGRTLGLHPPADWDPSADLVEHLLGSLEAAPWLDLVPPSGQTAGGEPALEPVELAPPEPGRLPNDLRRDIETALSDLDAAHAAQPPDLDEEAQPARSFADLRTAVLRSTSGWYAGSAEAEALVRDVKREVDRIFGDVEVASGSRVTLTAETGQIPITLRRTRGDPLTVRVEVASQGRLVWPEGRQSESLVLSDREAHTVSFPTQALSMGTFPVTVRVTDPSGERELERTTLSVRSTRVSGPALTATGGFVLVLLLAGALRRRPRRPHLAVVDDEEGPHR